MLVGSCGTGLPKPTCDGGAACAGLARNFTRGARESPATAVREKLRRVTSVIGGNPFGEQVALGGRRMRRRERQPSYVSETGCHACATRWHTSCVVPPSMTPFASVASALLSCFVLVCAGQSRSDATSDTTSTDGTTGDATGTTGTTGDATGTTGDTTGQLVLGAARCATSA